jgi:hypothetical protein
MNIKEFYAMSLKNRKSVTIVEMINVVDEFSLSSMIIIQEHDIMIIWFSNDLSQNTCIVSSNSNFTFDKIEIEYLKHYIKNSNAESNADWKLMLMNNHDSHMTSELIALINDNHIRFYLLISHLTHCMQSLNVNVFQSYKHWHNVTIQKTIAKSFVKYSLTQFLRDLTKIRNETFKSSTIRHAFEKSEMWSINSKTCIK